MEFSQLKEKMGILKPKRSWIKSSLIVLFAIATTLMVIAGVTSTYGKYYTNKVFPGVYVGRYHMGGMTAPAVEAFIENLNDRLSKEGLSFIVPDRDGAMHDFKVNTVLLSEDSTTELVKLDSERLTQMVLTVGRSGNWWQQLLAPVYFRFFSATKLTAPVQLDDVNLDEILSNNLATYEDKPRNANIRVTEWGSGTYDIVPEKSGRMFVLSEIKNNIIKNLSEFNFLPIKIDPKQFTPTIHAGDLQGLRDNVVSVFGYGDLGVNYIDSQTQLRRDWSFTLNQLLQWTVIELDDSQKPVLALDQDKVNKYLIDQVRPIVDAVPQDAKFTMENGKVKELKGSQSGVSLNIEKTFAEINKAFIDRNYRPTEAIRTVGVSVDVVEPQIKISDLNEFGIIDVLGRGVSTFRDSHSNRIKNIANAVARLNGVLIKPDEEFSAIKYAGPFTAENGFLPEEVIKGNKIKKEIGGGMCQIGTTLFRMAMNSGMDITARQNHSLVVSYYADPVNGNPGTDAALYEPFLDLKFKNDTGAYLLLQTDIDFKKQQLVFTLWGKSDGRKGWYTHPLVSKWIPAGEPQEVVSEELKPGETKCQNAFRGAVANFTYSRITPAGEKVDRVFTSYYRPLPKICMVGPSVSSSPTQAADGSTPDSSATSAQPDILPAE